MDTMDTVRITHLINLRWMQIDLLPFNLPLLPHETLVFILFFILTHLLVRKSFINDYSWLMVVQEEKSGGQPNQSTDKGGSFQQGVVPDVKDLIGAMCD